MLLTQSEIRGPSVRLAPGPLAERALVAEAGEYEAGGGGRVDRREPVDDVEDGERAVHEPHVQLAV